MVTTQELGVCGQLLVRTPEMSFPACVSQHTSRLWILNTASCPCLEINNSHLTDWEPVKLLSRVWLFGIPWTVAYQTPPPREFSKQGYWSGLPFLSPGNLPDPGIKPRSPALQADVLPSEPQGKLDRLRSQWQHTWSHHAQLITEPFHAPKPVPFTVSETCHTWAWWQLSRGMTITCPEVPRAFLPGAPRQVSSGGHGRPREAAGARVHSQPNC